MADIAYIFDDADRCGSSVFREYLDTLFTSGVFEDSLKVSPTGGMTISVSPGYVHLRGAVRYFADEVGFTLGVAPSGGDRIDAVMAEYSEDGRDITLKIVAGDVSDSTPDAPQPIRAGGVYQVVLANIIVRRGSVEIAIGSVVDTRPDDVICGFVKGRRRTLDVEQLLASFVAQQDRSLEEAAAEVDRWYNDVYLNIDPLTPEDRERVTSATNDNDEFVQKTRDVEFPRVRGVLSDLKLRSDNLGVGVSSRYSRSFDITRDEDVVLSDDDYAATDILIIGGSLQSTYMNSSKVAGSSYVSPRPIATFAIRQYNAGVPTDVFIAGMLFQDSSANPIMDPDWDMRSGYYNGYCSQFMQRLEITFKHNTAAKQWVPQKIAYYAVAKKQSYGRPDYRTAAANISISGQRYQSAMGVPYSTNNFASYNRLGGSHIDIKDVTALIST